MIQHLIKMTGYTVETSQHYKEEPTAFGMNIVIHPLHTELPLNISCPIITIYKSTPGII